MKQEDKEVLLRDLCARLPYGTIIEASIEDGTSMDVTLQLTHIEELINDTLIIKPYLRPMSSMTEEEKEKLELICDGLDIDDEGNSSYYMSIIKNHKSKMINLESLDWLNAHHFDYRGLIEKGLALEAPKDMYKID